MVVGVDVGCVECVLNCGVLNCRGVIVVVLGVGFDVWYVGEGGLNVGVVVCSVVVVSVDVDGFVFELEGCYYWCVGGVW